MLKQLFSQQHPSSLTVRLFLLFYLLPFILCPSFLQLHLGADFRNKKYRDFFSQSLTKSQVAAPSEIFAANLAVRPSPAAYWQDLILCSIQEKFLQLSGSS